MNIYKIKNYIICLLIIVVLVFVNTITFAMGPGGTSRYEEAEDAILGESTAPITHKVKEEGTITAGDKVGIRLGADGGMGGGSSSNKSTGTGKSSGGNPDRSQSNQSKSEMKAVKGNKKTKTETVVTNEIKETADASEINEETNTETYSETTATTETSKPIDETIPEAETTEKFMENTETLENIENINAETNLQRDDVMNNEDATVNEETFINSVQNRDDGKSFKGKKIFLLNQDGGFGIGGGGSSKMIKVNVFLLLISSILLFGFLRSFIRFQLDKKQSLKLK